MDSTSTIKLGALRHRVTIVKFNGTQDASGGTSLADYTLVTGTWAEIESLGGDDAVVAGAEMSQVVHLVKIRWMAGINASQQVLFNGRKFQIKAVVNSDERNKKLVLKCIEINESRQQ